MNLSLIEEDIFKIANAFLEQDWDGRYEVLESYWLVQQNESKYIFVAELDEHLAGYVTVATKAKHGPLQASGLLELANFNVFKKHQKTKLEIHY